jgi:glyoxylase I family protein
VAVPVDDLDAALVFYHQLGLDIDPSRPDFSVAGAWLNAGGQQVHLVVTPEPPAPSRRHFALEVADLDAAVTECEAAGIAVRRSAYTPGAGRQAVVHDPAGNAIELNQPERS